MAEKLGRDLFIGENVPGYILDGDEHSLPYIRGSYSDGSLFSDDIISLTRTSKTLGVP